MSTRREDILCADDLKEEFANHIHEICDFIEESAKKRIDAIQIGQIHLIQEAVAAEIALASGVGRIDIIMFLVERLQLLIHLEAQIKATEHREYQKTFDTFDINS